MPSDAESSSDAAHSGDTRHAIKTSPGSPSQYTCKCASARECLACHPAGLLRIRARSGPDSAGHCWRQPPVCSRCLLQLGALSAAAAPTARRKSLQNALTGLTAAYTTLQSFLQAMCAADPYQRSLMRTRRARHTVSRIAFAARGKARWPPPEPRLPSARRLLGGSLGLQSESFPLRRQRLAHARRGELRSPQGV